MSTKVTQDMAREAYKVAKRVCENEITRQDGIDDLVKRANFNSSTAADLVVNLGHMLDGKAFTRTNNQFTTSHFLEMNGDPGATSCSTKPRTRSRNSGCAWSSGYRISRRSKSM